VVVGKALEPWDPSSPTSTIMVFLNVSWYDPSVYIALDGQLVLPSGVAEASQANLATPPATPTPTGASPQPDIGTGPLLTSLLQRLESLSKQVDLLASQDQALQSYASISALLAQSTASSSAIFDSLTVLGRTTLSDLGVTGTINAGLLTISGDPTAASGSAINTLSGPLKLQSLALGSVELLGGKVKVDKDGNLTVEKTLTAKTIAAEEVKVLGQTTIGSDAIAPFATFVDVVATAAAETSRVFLTPTTLTSRQLVVTFKEKGKFRVQLTTPESFPIKFDWWIVN